MQGNTTEPNSPSVSRRGISITPRIYSEDTRHFLKNSPGNRTIHSRFQTHFKDNNTAKHSNTSITVNNRESDEFFIYGTKTAIRSNHQPGAGGGEGSAACSPSGGLQINAGSDIKMGYGSAVKNQLFLNNSMDYDTARKSNSCSRSGSFTGIQTVRENNCVNGATFVNTEIHPNDNGEGYCEYPVSAGGEQMACVSANEEEIEEIIEEEIRTVRKRLPQPNIIQPCESRIAQNAAVGDSNVNQVKVTENGFFDINNLSDEQLLCLEEMFRKKIYSSMPRKQDHCVQSNVGQQNASTMIKPPSPPPNRNVGMIFKPAMNEIGIHTAIPCTHQDSASCCAESEEEIRSWFKQRIGYMTDVNQNLILELACHFNSDRQKFITLLSEIIAKQKVSVGLECRPEMDTKHTTFTKTEFATNVGIGEDSTLAVIKTHPTPSSCKGINVRPDLKNHSINTDVIMTRTQASMAVPEPIETVEYGMVTDGPGPFCHRNIMTDPINNNTFHGQTPSEFLNSFISSSALESASQIYEKRMSEYRSKLICKETNTDCVPEPVKVEVVHQDVDATDPNLLQAIVAWNLEEQNKVREANKRTGVAQTQHKLPVNSYIHVNHASTIGPVRDTGTGGNICEDRPCIVEEGTKSKLLLESWEATTELDEKSEKKFCNSQQMLGNSSRISLEDINRCLANTRSQVGGGDSPRLINRFDTVKMREIPTRTEVVMEDFNGVQISSNCDVTVDRIPSNSANLKRRQLKMDGGESMDRTEAHIIQNSNISNLKQVYIDKNNSGVKPNLTQSSINYNEFPYNIKLDSCASRFPREFGMKRNEITRQTSSSTRSIRRKIPPRTYLYNMTESMQKCCTMLSEHLRANQFGQLDDSNKSMFNQITRTWFDLVKSRPNEEEIVKDYISTLYQYSPNLLEAVVNSPDDNGSTALHYAVGHGSWRLVNCLLNTHFMDVDKFNFSGYTPVMVSAISQAHTQDDLEVIDKMLNSSNVNLRSRANLQQTPLILAARQGSSKIVDLLLLHRAQVNLQDKAGNTAVMCAVDQGHADVVRKLLSCPDIDLSLKDNDGKDALTIAKLSGNQEIHEMVNKRLHDPTNFIRTNGITHRISNMLSPPSRYPKMSSNSVLHVPLSRMNHSVTTKTITKDLCSCPNTNNSVTTTHSWNLKSTLVL